jgi:hypothetical protein
VNRFTHAANRARYDAPSNRKPAMLRNSSQNSLSEFRSTSRTQHAPDPVAKTKLTKESQMSSQAFVRTNELRSNLAATVLLALLYHVGNGVAAFGRRFMIALRETRRSQAEQIVRRYGSMIDDD